MTAITHVFRFSGAGEDFGPRSDGLFIPHTTESALGRYTVADAIILARWQDRSDILGSYNRLICSDGILSTVPDDHASGGVNPSSASFKPQAWLYTVLDASEVNNPNFFGLNVAVMGQRAWFDANGWPKWAIDGLVACALDEEARIGRPVVFADHATFQTNRTDINPFAMAMVKSRYLQLKGLPPEDEMYQITGMPRSQAAIQPGAPLYNTPSKADFRFNAAAATPGKPGGFLMTIIGKVELNGLYYFGYGDWSPALFFAPNSSLAHEPVLAPEPGPTVVEVPDTASLEALTALRAAVRTEAEHMTRLAG